MSEAAGEYIESARSLRRRGLHSICTALSEKQNGKKNASIQSQLHTLTKMEQIKPGSMNLGGVEGRVITSVSHGTTNAPVVLAAALSNITEHSYAAASNGTDKEGNLNLKPSDGSSSGSSSDSSSSESEMEETHVATKEVASEPQQTVVTVVAASEGVKSSPRLRSAPQKYISEVMSPGKGAGTPSQPKGSGKPRGRPAKTPKSGEKKRSVSTETPDGTSRRRGRGCGKCAGCMRPDCGDCVFCKDKPKFGGPGVKKQRCANRLCSNFVKKPNAHVTTGARSQVSIVPKPAASGTPSTPSTSSSGSGSLDIRSFIGKTPSSSSVATPTLAAASLPINIVSSTSATTAMQTISSKVVAKILTMAPIVSSPKAIVSATKSIPSATTKSSTTPVAKSVPPPSKTTAPSGDQTTRPTTSAVTPAQQASTSPKKMTSAATTDVGVGEATMKCVQCGRERKVGMARTEQFCTQRCIIHWLEANPDKNYEDAMGEATPTVPSSVQSQSSSPPASSEVVSKKPVSRALKNLQIDMALPGTKLPLPNSDEEGRRSSSGSGDEGGRIRKKARLAPQLTAVTTRATRRSLASLTTNKVSKTTPPATRSATRSTASPGKLPATPAAGSVDSGAKRALSASAPHPPALKKIKTNNTQTTKDASKAVTFNLELVTDNQSTAPTFSLVPIDQLAGSLTSTLLDQHDPIPNDLPSSVRSWSVEQVVQYFRMTSDCRDFAELFAEQEVDGTALLLLTHEALVKCLGIKLGRAVKIMAHVDVLRHHSEAKGQ